MASGNGSCRLGGIRGVLLVVGVAAALVAPGCATGPPHYYPGEPRESPKTLRLATGEAQIERGKPNRVIDGLGHYLFSLPSKLILWNWRVDNHHITPEVESRLATYLSDNKLAHVKVRLNQYAPGGEWKRLFKNREVGAGWRYTVGVITNLFYTILPGRLLGGDHYNPFTNTVNIYSDHTAIAYHEGGHAKDFAHRKWKGTYAVIRLLPIVPLFQEYAASDDAVEYTRWKRSIEDEKSAYKILYPAYMTYVASEVLRWVTIDPLSELALQAVFVIPGHIAGRIKAANVDDTTRVGKLAVAPGGAMVQGVAE